MKKLSKIVDEAVNSKVSLHDLWMILSDIGTWIDHGVLGRDWDEVEDQFKSRNLQNFRGIKSDEVSPLLMREFEKLAVDIANFHAAAQKIKKDAEVLFDKVQKEDDEMRKRQDLPSGNPAQRK